jgi:crotonobetaine/carnitine-CoA ligase
LIPPGLPPVHPFVGRDVAWLLDERARLRAAHPFLVWAPFDDRPVTITYGELGFRTRAIAGGLAARGVRAGDRVLLHLDNGPEILLAWLACARRGAVADTTNTRTAGAGVANFADHAAAVAAITSPEHADLVTSHATGLRWTAVTGDESWRWLTDADPSAAPGRPVDPSAPMSVMYTSGTTSRPKGVLWTHANALWGARTNAVHQDLRADDVHLCVLPLFHTNALAYSSLATLWAGATVVLQPRFSASRFWAAALDHRCTWAIVTRFVWRALGAQEVPRDHRFRLWGNAWCEPPTDAEWGLKTIGWWGMTETISHGIVGDVHLPNRPMSMGRPAAEYGIAVRRPDGSAVAAGETGDQLVRGIPGLSLFAGYLDDPVATAAAYTEDDWFLTGDRVTLHDDGFLSFADRTKDMLRVGGENVAASEIERVIAAVTGVDEAAVVGRPHPMLDEVPVAFVIPAGGRASAPPTLADDIATACRTGLADFKHPRHIVLVDELPRATLGKVAKNVLRTEAQTLG